MKIIFTKDVARTGRRYEIKEVANGYGRHLVASGVAEIATPETVARIERKRSTDMTQKKVHSDLLLKNLANINEATVALRGKANEKGHLFASIHKEEIIAELKRSTRLDMDPSFMVLEKPLKETGTHSITIKVDGSEAVLTVIVEAL